MPRMLFTLRPIADASTPRCSSVPVVSSVVYANPKAMNEIVKTFNYIRYPAQDPMIQGYACFRYGAKEERSRGQREALVMADAVKALTSMGIRTLLRLQEDFEGLPGQRARGGPPDEGGAQAIEVG
eukprot:scaffold1778_cov246-Pinguiococcus_pyrenoidosus.AAC.9